MSEGDAKVTYDVGDLLDRMGTRIDTGFATVNAKLDMKADKIDIESVKSRLDDHGRRIGGLEDRQRLDEAAADATKAASARWTDWRRWAVGVGVIALASVPGFVAIFH